MSRFLRPENARTDTLYQTDHQRLQCIYGELNNVFMPGVGTVQAVARPRNRVVETGTQSKAGPGAGVPLPKAAAVPLVPRPKCAPPAHLLPAAAPKMPAAPMESVLPPAPMESVLPPAAPMVRRSHERSTCGHPDAMTDSSLNDAPGAPFIKALLGHKSAQRHHSRQPGNRSCPSALPERIPCAMHSGFGSKAFSCRPKAPETHHGELHSRKTTLWTSQRLLALHGPKAYDTS